MTPHVQLVISFDEAGNFAAPQFVGDGRVSYAHVVNALAVIQAHFVALQLATLARQQQQPQRRIVLPDGTLPPPDFS